MISMEDVSRFLGKMIHELCVGDLIGVELADRVAVWAFAKGDRLSCRRVPVF